MSAEDALGKQFLARRAQQLKDQGHSLVRPPRPAPDSVEAAMERHPAGKQMGPSKVIPGGRSSADDGEALKQMYLKSRASGELDAVAAKMREQMTPAERRAMIRRQNRPR